MLNHKEKERRCKLQQLYHEMRPMNNAVEGEKWAVRTLGRDPFHKT